MALSPDSRTRDLRLQVWCWEYRALCDLQQSGLCELFPSKQWGQQKVSQGLGQICASNAANASETNPRAVQDPRRLRQKEAEISKVWMLFFYRLHQFFFFAFNINTKMYDNIRGRLYLLSADAWLIRCCSGKLNQWDLKLTLLIIIKCSSVLPHKHKTKKTCFFCQVIVMLCEKVSTGELAMKGTPGVMTWVKMSLPSPCPPNLTDSLSVVLDSLFCCIREISFTHKWDFSHKLFWLGSNPMCFMRASSVYICVHSGGLAERLNKLQRRQRSAVSFWRHQSLSDTSAVTGEPHKPTSSATLKSYLALLHPRGSLLTVNFDFWFSKQAWFFFGMWWNGAATLRKCQPYVIVELWTVNLNM